MTKRTTTLALVAGLAIASIGSWNLLSAQQGVPSQPGTPSKPAPPTNPQPRPANPIPDPSQPQPRPADPIPGTDPKRPDQPANPPVQPPESPVRPDQPDRPADPDRPVAPGRVDRSDRYMRPFAFQSPQYEVRFNQSTTRLLTIEQRLLRTQQDMLKRLGDVRQLSGERQLTGLFDLVQEMLKQHGELTQYLIQSRTAWSGELDSPAPITPNPNLPGSQNERQDGITRPATTPSGQRR